MSVISLAPPPPISSSPSLQDNQQAERSRLGSASVVSPEIEVGLGGLGRAATELSSGGLKSEATWLFRIRPPRSARTTAEPWDEGDGFERAKVDVARVTESSLWPTTTIGPG